MILAQVFKTREGAEKRASFENHHSQGSKFRVIHYEDGIMVKWAKLDNNPSYRLEKTSINKPWKQYF